MSDFAVVMIIVGIVGILWMAVVETMKKEK
jgi:hypothetical protein